MTFIVGIKSCDGIVLCSDSFENDGITKNSVDKIQLIGAQGWSLAIAGAGSGSTIDKFVAALRSKMTKGQFDQQLMESEIEQELALFNSKYVLCPNDCFSVIVAACASPFAHLLYKASCFEGQSVVLTPVNDKCHVGVGNELWRFLSDTLYNKRNCVEDNIRVAVFATSLAIKYCSGVDGPIQAVSHTVFDQFWKGYGSAEISALEAEVSLREFKQSVQNYWRLHTPPSRSAQLAEYGGVRAPGDELTLIDGVKVEELSTISGLRRSIKTLNRNRGKLQQRGSLLAKRFREAHPNESQSSSDSADK